MKAEVDVIARHIEENIAVFSAHGHPWRQQHPKHSGTTEATRHWHVTAISIWYQSRPTALSG